ncbi:AAA family ATPase [Streptomyces sp. MST-110588]|uniref:AAA family ATPase n=1 Tax=Streptomyces sp. MST-110588 TaxID=2833628 RepID=UPI001F5CCBE7|nr:AAA family ATPase [Streptomyces sp. MST-110588]UNO43378.1 AAA family ATPase [Streptomyces sp. MST-110588]
MIIWLNGTFGVGKTTTSKELAAALPSARIFDSETVGYMLRPVLKSVPVADFQEWRPWRHLVVETAVQILDYVGGTLVIPQSVLVEQYWDEIETGLRGAGIPVHHFVLHADQDVLTTRIETDTVETGARRWRLDHLPDYRQALPWLSRRAHLIDTNRSTPAEVVTSVLATLMRSGTPVAGTTADAAPTS